MTPQPSSSRAELTITREFDAPKEMVFDAFASAEAMAQWWGPAEFPITVLSFDFKPNGVFHYKMDLPDQVWYGKFVYHQIMRPNLLEFTSSFSNANGEVTRAPFAADWPLEIFNRFVFSENNGKTTIKMMGYPVNPNDAETSLFNLMTENVQEGFGKTFGQLDRYLQAQSELRNSLHNGVKARTTTYLNFNGNTEEAFTFYKSVFKTELNGTGFQRFGDIPVNDDTPPITDEIKHLILHVELPIVGGHVLMATDAPESMGFKLVTGNNMHICLEPDSREETKRLFEALAEGGVITMPLEDMFFGAYFGSCTDKYGINWMVNCLVKSE
jgi:uncharacterized glyoxalase superfamily protein PhnB/uncharacterized protein YndB with AHSA1/START domain